MDNRLTTISLRRLGVFLSVCETLHIARAAERLNVAAPALSQQIRALEEALGVQLFHRRKRGIDLTQAGKACQEAATRLLAQHGEMMDLVQRTARGEMGKLVIGHVGSAMAGRVFPYHLQRMRKAFPDLDISLRARSISALMAAIAAREIDAALVRDIGEIPESCEVRLYATERLFVLVAQGHRLARRKQVLLREIRDEPVIGFEDPDEVGITKILQKISEENGTEIDVRWKVSGIMSIFGMVQAGLGISIVAESVTELLPKDLVAVPFGEMNAISNLWLMWNREAQSPALSAFIDLAEPKNRL